MGEAKTYFDLKKQHEKRRNAINTLDTLLEAVHCVKLQNEAEEKEATLRRYDVVLGDIIEHETGEIGVVYGSNCTRLFVRYLNYDHNGYELETKFKKISTPDFMDKILKK
jgi:hypothetical protein